MGNINYDHVEAYLKGLTPARDALLTRLEAYAERHGVPIVGPEVGRLLHILAGSIGAKRVLELGTAIGYSTIWLARAVAENGGTVVTVEGRDEMADRAEANLREAGLADRVEIVRGMAEDVVPEMEGPFDLIFNDVDKVLYPVLLPMLVELLRVGGLLVTDNVLWGGRVASPTRDPTTLAVMECNERLHTDPRLVTVIAPMRDGAAISWRVK
jgi:predicted O-methyltransferase YrrM